MEATTRKRKPVCPSCVASLEERVFAELGSLKIELFGSFILLMALWWTFLPGRDSLQLRREKLYGSFGFYYRG